ncbi:MAG: hypothetical protein E7032_02770 [Akkermansiaceae bacterium]|nr:hypothetical protein [Akkermansiaceae bacterium]
MAETAENVAVGKKRSNSKLLLVVIWMLVVAGLPIYYLRPDCDWDYSRWAAPEEILETKQSPENHLHGDEGVYTRVFVVRPSKANYISFDIKREQSRKSIAPFLSSLLREYELPPPYNYGSWLEYGWVDWVECGNGLLLVCDYSRNKGGLMSARWRWEDGNYPGHVALFYFWAWLSIWGLLLTVVLLVPGVVLYGLFRALKRFIRLVKS